MNYGKKKWIILVAVIAVVAFLDGLATNANLLDRAIVVGMAVDESVDGIQLSAQVIIPKNGGSASEGNDFAVYSSQGKTMQQAVENLSFSVGLKASFAHTGVIIFGDGFLKSGKAEVFEYLVQSDLVTDNTLLAAAAGEAKEILSVSMPLNEVASYHLIDMLQSGRKEAGQNSTNFKRFFEDVYKTGGTAWLPLVYLRESEFSQPGSSSPSDEKSKFLDVSHVVVMNREGYVVRLGKRQSCALSYTTEKLNAGTVPYEGDDGYAKEAVILRSECEKKVVDENTVRLALDLSVRPSQKYYVEGGGIGGISQEEQKKIADTVITEIADCFEVCKYFDADIFHLGEELYRRYGEKWKMCKDEYYLNDITLKIAVNVVVK